jgi:hypothetical protein
VSGALGMILAIVVPGGLAILLALLLLRRGRAWLGFVVGLAVILAVQAVEQVRLWREVENCVERACRLISDPAACQAASFGCHEWTGLAALFYLVAAGIDVVALVVVFAIAAALRHRRRGSAASS